MKQSSWTKIEQATFLKNLGVLLEKGYSISESLTLLELQYQRQRRFPIRDIRLALQKGTPFVEVLEQYGIPTDILGYLFFSSEHGSLPFGLKEASAILEKREHVKKVFYQKIRYPLALLSLLGAMMFFMLHFLFPQFITLFHSVDLQLPMVTRVMMTIFEYVPTVLYIILAITILSFVYLYFKLRNSSPFENVSRFLHVPLLSTILKTFLTHYFASQFGHLLKGGLSVSLALQLFEKQNYMKFFQIEAGLLVAELRVGESLNRIVQKRHYYLPELSQVIQFGQSNGRLGEELVLYSEMLLNRAEEQTERYLTMIQPILFALIGSIVLTLFLSVMLPIFRLFQSL